MLESSFNKLTGFKTCNFLIKRLQHRCFPLNIAKFLKTLILMKICEQLLVQFLLLTVNISSQGFVSALNSKGLLQRSFSKSSPQGSQWQVPLLFEKKKNQPKQSLVVNRCHSLYHSSSLVVIRCHSLCQSLSFVITRCITRLSFYKRSFLCVLSFLQSATQIPFLQIYLFQILYSMKSVVSIEMHVKDLTNVFYIQI